MQPFLDLYLSGDKSYDSAAPHHGIDHTTVRKWAQKPIAIIQIPRYTTVRVRTG